MSPLPPHVTAWIDRGFWIAITAAFALLAVGMVHRNHLDGCHDEQHTARP